MKTMYKVSNELLKRVIQGFDVGIVQITLNFSFLLREYPSDTHLDIKQKLRCKHCSNKYFYREV